MSILIGVLGSAVLLTFWIGISWAALELGLRTVREAGGDEEEYLRQVAFCLSMPDDFLFYPGLCLMPAAAAPAPAFAGVEREHEMEALS